MEPFLDSGSSRCNGTARFNSGQFLASPITFNTLRQSHRESHIEIGFELDNLELGKGLVRIFESWSLVEM